MRQQRELADGLAWELDGKAVTMAEAAEWIMMERRCCPFLTLVLEPAGKGTNFSISLKGPPTVKAFLASEFGAPL